VSPSFFLQLRQRFFLGFFAGIGSSFSSSVFVEVEGVCVRASLEASHFDSDSTFSTFMMFSDKVVCWWRSDLEVVLVLGLSSLVWELGASFFWISL